MDITLNYFVVGLFVVGVAESKGYLEDKRDLADYGICLLIWPYYFGLVVMELFKDKDES